MGSLAQVQVDRGLPRGRARMPAEVVGAAHRSRLLRAVVGAVADRGYANVRIADIVDRARVSRQSFYTQFDGKEECFLAAHADGIAVLLAEFGAQIAGAEMPVAQLAGGIDTYFALAEREPEFARCMLIELPAISPAGLAAHLDAHAQVAALLAAWHAAARTAAGPAERWPAVPTSRYAAVVGAVHDLVFELVADQDRPRERPPAEDALDAALVLLEIPR
ncbi:MAG TPA: helix-turn-helix domain-containing protein [Solirubrobacteraceae bacterium]|nr:helix-turn-helix domain-containing protein [Solirubrobacteraceae bacterium]